MVTVSYALGVEMAVSNRLCNRSASRRCHCDMDAGNKGVVLNVDSSKT